MKKYVIEVNDRIYEVRMGEANEATDKLVAEARAKGTLGMTLAATAAPAAPVVTAAGAPGTPVSQASAPPAGTATGTGEIVAAPMPGSIVGIHVQVGDVVKKGQLLLVLEAMKMENEIVSPLSGTITAVGVAKGAVVDVSDMLVQIG